MNLQGLAREALVISDAQDAAFVDGVAAHGLTEYGNAMHPDGKMPESLEAHDRRFHPDGYKEGADCKFRDALEQGDENDELVSAPFPSGSGVTVEMGDITKQDGVDAIVNAANRWMLGGGGVDGAIHRAAGPKLREECEKYPPDANGYRVQTGEAKITGAGDLPNKWVIHTAGPDIRDYLPPPEPVTAPFSLGNPQAGYESPDLFDLFEDAYGDDEPTAFSPKTPVRRWDDPANITEEQWEELDTLLGNSYRNSMELAAEHGAKSIAFPSISTGIFGFPVERAAKVAAREIAAFREKHPDVSVKMCIYDPSPDIARNNMQQYQDAFEEVGLTDAGETPATDNAPLSQAEYVAEFKKYFGYRDDYTPKGTYRKIGDAIAGECAMRAPYDTAARETEGDAVIALVTSGDPEGEEAGRNLGDCMMKKGKHDKETLLKRMGETYKVLLSLAGSQEEAAGRADAQDAASDAESTSTGPGSPTDLQKHDAKYHPKGFDPNKDKCKYRENLAKGDEADASLMDPENIEGDDEGAAPSGQSAVAQLQGTEKTLGGKIADIANGMTGTGLGVDDLMTDLGAYEKAYDQATGTTPGTKALSALSKQIKGGGLTAQLLQAQLAAAKQASAAANLPSGTKTPEEMRNEVAMAFAKLLGANLVVAGSEQPSVPAAAAAAPGKQRQNPNIPEEIEDAIVAAGIDPTNFTKAQDGYCFAMNAAKTDAQAAKLAQDLAKVLPAGMETGIRYDATTNDWSLGLGTPAQVHDPNRKIDRFFESGTGNEITPAAQGATQFGPRPAMDISASTFPPEAAFDFANYGSGKYTSAGSGSTSPHKITINGDTYFVKKAGVNSDYSKAAAQNEVNANKFIRLAGFNAPESKFFHTKDGDFCVTKACDVSGGELLPHMTQQNITTLNEAYPLMAMMYNTDILINNDNAFIDKNGEVVFLDNGSTFGFSAQGRRPNKNLQFDFDTRTEPDSTKNSDEGIMALRNYSGQAGWKRAVPNYQAGVLANAAKYNMGALAKEAIKQGLVPKSAEKAFQTYADNLDKLSGGGQNAYAGASASTAAMPQQQAAASSAPAASAQSQAQPSQTPSSSSTPTASTQTTSAPQGQAAMTGQSTPFMSNGAALFNTIQGVSATWTPNVGTRQSRNATGFLNAVASIPRSAFLNQHYRVTPMGNAAHNALLGMFKGTFTANKSGIGGVVTGANIPRKGVQALGKYLNQILNPQGYKIQIHNNGNVSISASNSAIANSALKAAGVPTSNTATQTSSPAQTTPPPASSQATPAATPPPATQTPSGNNAGGWRNLMSGLQSAPQSKSLGSAYGTVANWLNNAAQNGQI